MKFRVLPVVAALILAAGAACALDLAAARASGAVGETPSGYVTAIESSAEVEALVSSVNAKRKAEYARISKQNGQPVEVVGQLAAPQIIGGLPKGSKYQDASGAWKTR